MTIHEPRYVKSIDRYVVMIETAWVTKVKEYTRLSDAKRACTRLKNLYKGVTKNETNL